MDDPWPLDRAWVGALEIGWPARYERPEAANWVTTILQGLRRHGVEIVPREIPQEAKRLVVLEVATGGVTHRVAIDYADDEAVDAQVAADAAVYFKLAYRARGYPEPKVLPGGYVPARHDIYPRLWALRAARGRPRFRWDVYGRFGMRDGSETRRRAHEILSARGDIRYEGSLFRYPGGPDKVPYRRYLFEVTRARVCVDVQGSGDLTFRLVDYLALGACVVRPRRAPARETVRLHVPLVDGVHVAFCEPDLSDLGDLCARLAADGPERERLARNARAFFDRYLHRRRLAAYYLHEIHRATQG